MSQSRPTQHPPERRRENTPRRRAGDPTPRRRSEDHKKGNSAFGALLTIVVAVMFLGYIFNISGFATAADTFFSSLNSSAQSHGDAVVTFVTAAAPLAGLLFAVIVLYMIFRAMQRGARSRRKERSLSSREVMSLHDFKDLTADHGIRPRIATQAYELLLPYYSSSMRARLSDRLIEDLHMTPAQVVDLYGNLLRNTDRKAKVGEENSLHTVLDLLQSAQNAARQSLMNSTVRPAMQKMSVIRPARRASENAESRNIVGSGR